MFLVGIGGAIGAMLRFGTSMAVAKWCEPRAFPLGTLLINWIGSFVIGWLTASIFQHESASERLRWFAMTGILGGFTTFSAFSIETATLLAERRYTAATVYLLLSTLGCVGLAVLGLRLGR